MNKQKLGISLWGTSPEKRWLILFFMYPENCLGEHIVADLMSVLPSLCLTCRGGNLSFDFEITCQICLCQWDSVSCACAKSLGHSITWPSITWHKCFCLNEKMFYAYLSGLYLKGQGHTRQSDAVLLVSAVSWPWLEEF